VYIAHLIGQGLFLHPKNFQLLCTSGKVSNIDHSHMDLKQFFSASFRAPTNSAPVTKLLDSNDELKKTATVTNASMPSTRNKTRRSFVEHQAAQIRVQVIKESLNQFCSSHRWVANQS
jgi:hypothetical protein